MLVVTTNRRPCGRTKTTGGMETDRLPGLPTPCSPPAPLRPIGAGRPWGEVTSTTSVQVSWPCVDGLRSKGDSEAAAGPCHPKVNAPAPPRLSTAALPKTTSCTLRHTLDPSARWGVRLRTEFPGKRVRGPKQSRIQLVVLSDQRAEVEARRRGPASNGLALFASFPCWQALSSGVSWGGGPARRGRALPGMAAKYLFDSRR